MSTAIPDISVTTLEDVGVHVLLEDVDKPRVRAFAQIHLTDDPALRNVALIFNVRGCDYDAEQSWLRELQKDLRRNYVGTSWYITKIPTVRLESIGGVWTLISNRGVIVGRSDKPVMSEADVRAFIENHNDTMGRDEYHFITIVNMHFIF